MSLNKKQEQFAYEYVKDLNRTQAAIRAGYSEKTAYSIGQRLLKNVEVSELIEKLSIERKNKDILDIEDVMKGLSDIASGKPKTVISKRVDNETGEVERDVSYTLQPEDQDRLKALELLGKRYSMFTDKVEQTNKNIEIEIGEFEDEK